MGRVSAQPRAVRVGTIAAVAHRDAAELAATAERLASRGYGVARTPRFAVARRPPARLAIVLHAYDERSIDEDVAPLLAEELGGHLATADEYGTALFAIVASTCPRSLDCARCGGLHLDQPAIWRHYCLNTLDRLRPLLAEGAPTPDSHIGRFAAVYRRVAALRFGSTVLDVGSNLGLLPVLLAERGAVVTGCDVRPESVAVSADLAAAAGAAGVSFRRADVLAGGLGGPYDTVTAVHLLEHLADEELPVAMAALLEATSVRLLVAVPYETRVEPLYGHRQAFTADRLRAWGDWCVRRMGGGRWWCEDVEGGLLAVDRPVSG
jgi:SAM-dependent methyltransferase